MNDIEQKALALLKDCGGKVWEITRNGNVWVEALCRAIEQHEAFRQEVSDAVAEIAKAWGTADPAWGYLRRFIIPKPDPLVEAMADCGVDRFESWADQLRAALAKRGLEIREKK